eukprot:7387825-Prymnesium_polylepis.1
MNEANEALTAISHAARTAAHTAVSHAARSTPARLPDHTKLAHTQRTRTRTLAHTAPFLGLRVRNTTG